MYSETPPIQYYHPPAGLDLRPAKGRSFLTVLCPYSGVSHTPDLVRLFLLVDREPARAHVHEEDEAADNR